jgi:crotonobetainyl-CoA:carnitine CoA-transferase CaiB-like acyl-CoA transferase
VDLAQVECLFQLGADEIIAAQLDGDPPRMGNRNPHIAPRTVVLTADPEDALAVTVTDEDAWAALCGVLGRPGWIRKTSMATPAGRNARGDEIDAALTAWARSRTVEDAAAALQRAGVPAAPVVPSHGLVEQPHMAAAGSWMRIERRHVGRHLMAAPPYRIDGERPAVLRPAPLLGEHTAEVLDALQLA